MKVYLGSTGLDKTWQKPFKDVARCVKCSEDARIAFVAYEGAREKAYISNLHPNRKGSMWLHDACSVAVYFCSKCLSPTAVYNQG